MTADFPSPTAPIARRTMLGASLLIAAGGAQALAQAPGSINARMSGDIAPVHDPCIIKQGDTYYLFCTTGGQRDLDQGYVPCRTSRDLVTWERAGAVFTEIPAWAREDVPRSRGIWAPDIAYFNNKYHLYYSVSSFGSNHSVIGLATNTTLDRASPDFRWEDQGMVIRSRRHDRFNAIDPNIIQDREGKVWMSWGSFWTGLKMTRIEPSTGKRHTDDEIHDLAWRPVGRGEPSAIEAPFIIARGDYYYLFASYDFCCRGVESTYFMAVGRSRSVTGPYLGPDDKPMMEGGGAIVVDPDARFRAFGHNSVLREADRDYLVFHAYDLQNTGTPTLRISPIHWTTDGWPRAAL